MYRIHPRIIGSFTAIGLAGVLLGQYRHDDTALAAFLAVCLLLLFWLTSRNDHSFHGTLIVACGVLLTGLLGVVAEHWGISNGYWVYHDLPDQRTFARWLPFAWMCAFLALYRVEIYLIGHFGLSSLHEKIVLAATISIVLPTWGEIAAIQSGVWTYHWPYQLLGVPLLAIILIAILHTSIFFLLALISKKFRVKDSYFYY